MPLTDLSGKFVEFWDDLPEEEDVYYRYDRCREVTQELENSWFVPYYCSGSDYSGGSHTLANFRYMGDLILELGDGTKARILFGVMGSYAVAFHWEFLNSEDGAGILKDLESLEDYPCISDELTSEIEMELEQEAMPDVIRHLREEIRRASLRQAALALVKCGYEKPTKEAFKSLEFNNTIDEDYEGLLTSLDDEQMAIVLHQASQWNPETGAHEVYWESEHCSSWINTRDLVDNIRKYEEWATND